MSAPPITQHHSTESAIVMRTAGGLLEVSTITTEERFDSNTSHTILGVPVGRTIAQIRVPAVYRYHVPLASEWTFREQGKTLIVIAPKVKPSLPVAIETDKLQSFSSGLWSPFTGTETVAALQQSITNKLGVKASSAELINIQREAARQTITEFIQKWAVNESRWTAKSRPTVLVFFEDEPLGKKAAPLFLDP